MTLLSVDGLTKEFGGLTAVDDLSFGVDSGEILGLIGPNGSGKTTVFNCIMSVYAVTSGTVRFDGTDITDDKTHQIVNRGVSRVSQESNPIGSMTVGENIELFTFPNSIRSFDGGASDDEIASYAAQVGIEDALEEDPGSLPHADVRRLEIAKALATEPDLLLLDEPFAGLNQTEVRQLSEQFEAFREQGITLVVVDHNMRGLLDLVDRVVVLHNGQKLASGNPDDVAADERVQNAYLAGEMSAVR